MENKELVYEEKILKAKSGFLCIVYSILLFIIGIVMTIVGASKIESMDKNVLLWAVPTFVVGILVLSLCWLGCLGLRIVKPNEALVVVLFGKYIGTIRKEGFYFINIFSSSVNPGETKSDKSEPQILKVYGSSILKKRNISLKVMTLVNTKQKINDELGNPIEVGIVVIWRIINTAKACFNVDNYNDFISTQADSALRDVVRTYPYDISSNGDEASLRGSSQEVAGKIKEELQKRVEIAGIEIKEARITHLAYATEIAAAMLQRQQAVAIIEARQKIVEGAVGMVQMALEKLSKDKICELDDERKAQMVSNLLVVLCGNKDAQPIINSGTIY